ncbi:hypothetical protein GUITHDRAFT_140960 [Guillardia theta CCMP2712]|uniref:Uncharacterized protein n=1 Tax=Guillardia theta (strain CCMP2712) TaxID=905079 RepID=L1J3E7_GUITC|nr:hypothetical protein GUITHDRAFT_140960 [Guillardia theta CCMP2712]EKX42812.1 hypothetical protein GUITHDRAFT_140960 [Guillardia theta CCMP2712]|eukprot:XP_005829792.1 hypothetical protein GUITHDRAFT_140960 [Guillardia theta CCMP2712]
MASFSASIDTKACAASLSPSSPAESLDLELAVTEPPQSEFDGSVLAMNGRDVQKRRRKHHEDHDWVAVSPEETELEMDAADDMSEVLHGISKDIFFAGGDMAGSRRAAGKDDDLCDKPSSSSYSAITRYSSNKKTRKESRGDALIFPGDFNTERGSYVIEEKMRISNDKDLCMNGLRRLSLKVQCDGPPGMLLNNVLNARDKRKQTLAL